MGLDMLFSLGLLCELELGTYGYGVDRGERMTARQRGRTCIREVVREKFGIQQSETEKRLGEEEMVRSMVAMLSVLIRDREQMKLMLPVRTSAGCTNNPQ